MKTSSLDVLEKAELPSAHARAILRAMEMEWEVNQQTLATKADLDGLRNDFERLALATQAGFGAARLEVKADLAAVKSELMRWVFTCILAQTGVLMGALYFIVTFLRK